MRPETTDVLIVGGGLSGLAIAREMTRLRVSFHLLEARSRFGGRIKTAELDQTQYDLGPSWFWPGQPRMHRLIRDLNVTAFAQYSEGASLYQDEDGRVLQNQGFASMAGSLRVDGGMATIVGELVKGLSVDRLHLDCAVSAVSHGVVHCEDGHKIRAQQIVLALPPRLAASLLATHPNAANALSQIPTWMAAHAKFVAIYDAPFWRSKGLSGDVISRVGPLAEIHDASPAGGAQGALFGFVGLPADRRLKVGQNIENTAVSQLFSLFGADAGSPRKVFLMDWAASPETAVAADRAPPRGHPDYGPIPEMRALAAAGIFVAGSEVASEAGGFLEGALAAAKDVCAQLTAEVA